MEIRFTRHGLRQGRKHFSGRVCAWSRRWQAEYASPTTPSMSRQHWSIASYYIEAHEPRGGLVFSDLLRRGGNRKLCVRLFNCFQSFKLLHVENNVVCILSIANLPSRRWGEKMIA